VPTPSPKSQILISTATSGLEPAIHRTLQRFKKPHGFQTFQAKNDPQAPEKQSKQRAATASTTPTHDHSTGLPLARAELLVSIVHDEVEEHVKAAEDARDLSTALEVEEQAAVHELCGREDRGQHSASSTTLE
jgi:hypothetical protein